MTTTAQLALHWRQLASELREALDWMGRSGETRTNNITDTDKSIARLRLLIDEFDDLLAEHEPSDA